MSSVPKTLDVTESHQLLNAVLVKAGTEKQFRKGIRNYTMALLMLDAGLRVGEVVQLRISDLWFNSQPVTSIIISADIAKNKTERIIPASVRLCAAIKNAQIHYWTPESVSSNYHAFTRIHSYDPLTTRQVERIIRAAAMKSIGRPIHPHVLRHTFGTRVERKAGLRCAQELLGHKNVSSTQIYTHPNKDDLKNAIHEICEDPQEEHLMITDSALDSHASNSVEAPGTNHNHR